MTGLYLKSCPRCTGDVEFIPGGGADLDDGLTCIQCGWSVHRGPADAALLRQLDPRYADAPDRRTVVAR